MKNNLKIVLSLVLAVVIALTMISASSCQKEVSSSSGDSLTPRSDAVRESFIDDSITLSTLYDYTGIAFPEGSEIECAVRELLKNQPQCYLLEGIITVKINVPYECKDQLTEAIKKVSDKIDKKESVTEGKIFAGLPHEADKTYSEADHHYMGVKHIDDEYRIIVSDIYTVEGDSTINVYLAAEETLIR